MTDDFRRSPRRVFLTRETPSDIAAILDECIAEFLGGTNHPEAVFEKRGDFLVLRLSDDEGQA